MRSQRQDLQRTGADQMISVRNEHVEEVVGASLRSIPPSPELSQVLLPFSPSLSSPPAKEALSGHSIDKAQHVTTSEQAVRSGLAIKVIRYVINHE